MSTADVAAAPDSVTSLSTPNPPSPPPSSEHLTVPAPSTTQNEAAESSPTPEPSPNDAQPSQPVTAAASPSSQDNHLDDDDDANSAAPYGTRSRNRTGGARPNYADDKELDLEIEAAGRITTTKASKKVTAAATSAAPVNGVATVNDSLAVTNGDAGSRAHSHAGTPAPAPAPSKKRKQPGSNSTVANTTAGYPISSRAKASQPSQYVETNLMSFSRCGNRLNAKKQLVADDGTVLAANGQRIPPSPSQSY